MKTIFHTSFCASTYLASLLSKSITTFCEPDCSHNLKSIFNLDKQGDFLIKFPSRYCFFAAELNYKKIFLYRKLKNQLQKFKKNKDFFDQELKYNYDVMKKNLHKKNKIFKYGDNFLLNSAFLWADRFHWILNSNNVFYLETNDFLKNIKEKLNLICRFYEIEFKPIDVDFHVKKYNLNINNESINIDSFKVHEKYDTSIGIEEYVFDEEIEEISNNIKSIFPEFIKYI